MRNAQTLTAAFFLLLSSSACFAQFGGGQYGRGGLGNGGQGQSMGGMNNTDGFKPQMPNIAGDLANKETKWLKEKLNLTKEQGKEVKTLNNEYAKQQQDAIKEIFGADGGRSNPKAGQQVRDAMMMYNEEKEDKLKLILTPGQWDLYQSKKPDMQREVGGIRPPAPKRDSSAVTAGKQ